MQAYWPIELGISPHWITTFFVTWPSVSTYTPSSKHKGRWLINSIIYRKEPIMQTQVNPLIIRIPIYCIEETNVLHNQLWLIILRQILNSKKTLTVIAEKKLFSIRAGYDDDGHWIDWSRNLNQTQRKVYNCIRSSRSISGPRFLVIPFLMQLLL